MEQDACQGAAGAKSMKLKSYTETTRRLMSNVEIHPTAVKSEAKVGYSHEDSRNLNETSERACERRAIVAGRVGLPSCQRMMAPLANVQRL